MAEIYFFFDDNTQAPYHILPLQIFCRFPKLILQSSTKAQAIQEIQERKKDKKITFSRKKNHASFFFL